jgi:hypothetical protein
MEREREREEEEEEEVMQRSTKMTRREREK